MEAAAGCCTNYYFAPNFVLKMLQSYAIYRVFPPNVKNHHPVIALGPLVIAKVR